MTCATSNLLQAPTVCPPNFFQVLDQKVRASHIVSIPINIASKEYPLKHVKGSYTIVREGLTLGWIRVLF